MTPSEISAINDRIQALEVRVDRWSVIIVTVMAAIGGINLAVG